jgi:hypothetical protein
VPDTAFQSIGGSNYLSGHDGNDAFLWGALPV